MFQKIAKHRANDASNDVHRPPLPFSLLIGLGLVQLFLDIRPVPYFLLLQVREVIQAGGLEADFQYPIDQENC